jgi:hypothetical protein
VCGALIRSAVPINRFAPVGSSFWDRPASTSPLTPVRHRTRPLSRRSRALRLRRQREFNSCRARSGPTHSCQIGRDLVSARVKPKRNGHVEPRGRPRTEFLGTRTLSALCGNARAVDVSHYGRLGGPGGRLRRISNTTATTIRTRRMRPLPRRAARSAISTRRSCAFREANAASRSCPALNEAPRHREPPRGPGRSYSRRARTPNRSASRCTISSASPARRPPTSAPEQPLLGRDRLLHVLGRHREEPARHEAAIAGGRRVQQGSRTRLLETRSVQTFNVKSGPVVADYCNSGPRARTPARPRRDRRTRCGDRSGRQSRRDHLPAGGRELERGGHNRRSLRPLTQASLLRRLATTRPGGRRDPELRGTPCSRYGRSPDASCS